MTGERRHPEEGAGGRRQGGGATVSRRGWLKGAAGLVGGLVLGPARPARGAEPDLTVYPVPPDPTKVLGRPVSTYGDRSQFERHVLRWRYPTPTDQSSWTMSPLHDQRGIITPSALHFERHHGGVPTTDPSKHRLFIFGMVERPLELSLEDLMGYPAVSRVLFLECAGNTFSEWAKPTLKDVQQTHGLLSGSEWTGVLLSTLLREVGVKPAARWIVGEGADAARMNRSIPLEKAWEDAIVAYGQNGEALRPEQGYPIRLLLPGWEGNANIKWLHVLKVTDRPYETREETSKYTDLTAGGVAYQFSFAMEAKSVITSPSAQRPIRGRGFVEIRGLAWSGRGRIARVEVSTDGGRTWGLAELQEPLLPKALTPFRFPWTWAGQGAVLESRCTDETGHIQPTREALVKARGLAGPYGSVYHYNGIQSWTVAPDGSIHNGAA